MPGLLIPTPVTEESTCAHQECGGDTLKPSARTILERCDVQELRELERLRRLVRISDVFTYTNTIADDALIQGWNEAALQSYYDGRRRNADEHGRLAFETQRFYYNAVEIGRAHV